jgi:SecD/SecF fusion protein
VSERRSHLTLVGIILAALIGVALIAIPGSPIHKKPTLGLDLQGGLEVVLKAQPPPGHPLTSSDLGRSVDIMRSRIDKLGVSEPEIRKQGSDQIVIELAGIHRIADAVRLIGKTAQLEFYDLEADLVSPVSLDVQGFPIARSDLYSLLALVQSTAKQGKPSSWYLFDDTRKLRAGPSPTRAGLLKKRDGQVPKGWKVFAVPAKTAVISCPVANGCPGIRQGTPPSPRYYYLFKYLGPGQVPEMTGADLKLSGTRQDFDPNTNQPIVTMQFTKHGASVFHDITRKEAQRGRLRTNLVGGGQDVFQHFAIVLDREIKSTPYIDFHQNPDGIPGTNGAEINGIQSIREAKDLALVLQTGALPVKFVTVERTDVSATLGKDSLQEAKRAALIGLVVVAIFLLLLYRFLGLVAVVGLAIYVAFLYAAILLFGVTLTLPGFAGMILTIGVAADANVVVFERIKEEVRAGKSVRAAIAAGYAKGFHTIIDANVVTCITALVLFAVATAGVKGFALMLLIGTAISLLTAVAATRAMLGLLAGFKWFDNPRFMGASGQQGAKWLQIDFMRRRYTWFAISGVVMAIAAGSLAVRGLNLGIDFKGGVQVTFATPQPTSLADVRQQAADIGRADAVVQGRGKLTGSDSYTNFQLRLKKLTPLEQTRLTQDLQQQVHATKLGIKNVSSSFGRQIAKDALLAIAFSLFLIVLYLAIRFDLKFAIPVIVALLHDLLITVGIYSLTAREVTTATVAAVLTVLGYSIYDTIIIFDRIRENVPLMRKYPFAQIANVSLWETIRRSLATTFITLLPVASLLLFGGATLKDFAFALLVGIGSGAYSSIFIAAPLLTILKEREPEWARRKAVAVDAVATDGDEAALAEATQAAAAEPAPELSPVAAVERAAGRDAKRERRRQRRRTRPHGRAR